MIKSVASDCSDPTLLGNFIENHDNPRFASYVPFLPSLSPFTITPTNEAKLHIRLLPSQKRPQLHLPLRRHPHRLRRRRTALLRRRRALQPRSDLAIRLRHLRRALHLDSHHKRDPQTSYLSGLGLHYLRGSSSLILSYPELNTHSNETNK